jgi:hypothetical protein
MAAFVLRRQLTLFSGWKDPQTNQTFLTRNSKTFQKMYIKLGSCIGIIKYDVSVVRFNVSNWTGHQK